MCFKQFYYPLGKVSFVSPLGREEVAKSMRAFPVICLNSDICEALLISPSKSINTYKSYIKRGVGFFLLLLVSTLNYLTARDLNNCKSKTGTLFPRLIMSLYIYVLIDLYCQRFDTAIGTLALFRVLICKLIILITVH